MERVRSEVDGEIQDWLQFELPVYAAAGDHVKITNDKGEEIVWAVHTHMVVMGCRLDGWLIESFHDNLYSVDFDIVNRVDEDDDAWI